MLVHVKMFFDLAQFKEAVSKEVEIGRVKKVLLYWELHGKNTGNNFTPILVVNLTALAGLEIICYRESIVLTPEKEKELLGPNFSLPYYTKSYFRALMKAYVDALKVKYSDELEIPIEDGLYATIV